MSYRITALRYFLSTLALSVACSLVGFAQATSSTTQPTRVQAPKETPTDRAAILLAEWTRAKLGVQEYIEAMPESGISFKPTPEIRSFAEQMLHLAGGNYMFAATAAGLYPNVEEAMHAMGQGFYLEYKPNASNAATYAKRYKKYKALGELLEQKSSPVLADSQV